MSSKIFPGSWESYFVGRKFGIILINASIYVREDASSWARITHESHTH